MPPEIELKRFVARIKIADVIVATDPETHEPHTVLYERKRSPRQHRRSGIEPRVLGIEAGEGTEVFRLLRQLVESVHDIQPPVFGGVPSFFRHCCRAASSGGKSSYTDAGRELARHIDTLVPDDCHEDDWQNEVELLETLAQDHNEEEVWSWFQARFPRCMKLVPERRRDAFVAGVCEQLNEYT